MKQPTIYIVLKEGYPIVFADQPTTIYIYDKDRHSSEPWIVESSVVPMEMMTDHNQTAFNAFKGKRRY